MSNVSLVDGHVDEPKITCKNCKHLMFSDMYGECSKGYKGIVNPWDSCEHAELESNEPKAKKPITNYDRIRNMSIEEMAELFSKSPCYCCKQHKDQTCKMPCKQGVKQWLESEVTDNDR